MPFNSAALTAAQYTTLRGTNAAVPSYAASEYVAFLPNTVVFAALVNGAPSGTSFAQVTFDTVTVGAYTDVQIGQTVLIGTDSDIRNATFVGRVRLAATSTVLAINETSDVIADNAYIFVINDYRIWDRLSRVSAGAQLKDYSLTFQNTPPYVYNLQSVYAGVVDGTGKINLSFAPLAQAVMSGATISSWLWTVPTGMTITVGSTTTQNITATFDSGFNGFVTVAATDSNSKTGVFHFWVISVAADFSNVVNLDTNNTALTCDNGSWSGSLTAFDGVSTLLDNTLTVIFDVERYNGVAGSLFANVKFIGRIRVERDSTTADATYSLLKKTEFDLEGVLDQLGREEHLPFALVTKNSPAKWDEIASLTIPRAIVYSLIWHTTLLTLHALSFDVFDNTWLYPLLPTQGGNIQGVINDLVSSINASLQSAPTGELQIIRNAVYLSNTQRSSLVTVANFEPVDWIDIQPLTISETDETGKVQASGGFYNSTSGKVVPLLSLAPGAAQGVGAGVNNFARQVLIANSIQSVAQAELNTRTGNQYASVQRKAPELQLSFPPGYNWLVPSVNQWYTFAIPADLNTGGRVYTASDRWQCISINIAHDNTVGSKTIQAVFRLETQGTPGQTVIYPAPGTIIPTLPVLPPVPPYPGLPGIPDIFLPPIPTINDGQPYTPPLPKGDGSVVLIWSSTQVWVGTNFIASPSPNWNEITPPYIYGIVAACWSGDGVFILMNDTINSQSFVAYTPHGTSATPEWTLGAAVTGIYQTIRSTATLGEVYIAGLTPTAGGGCDLSGWTVALGTEVSRTASTIVIDSVLVAGSKVVELKSAGTADCCISSSETQSGGGAPVIQWNVCGEAYPGDFPGVGLNHTGLFPIATCINALLIFGASGSDIGQITAVFDNAASGCGSGTSYDSKVAYSSDFGATFATPEAVSPTLLGFIGFDVERVGLPSLVGAGGQVKMATTAGGAYSDYGSAFPTGAGAHCIHIPRYQFGSTITGNISTSTPQYLAASAILTAGLEAFWKVGTSGTVFSDITVNIGGDYGLAVSPDCITMAYKSGKRIIAIMQFGTDRHLIVSGTSGSAFTDRGVVGTDAAYVRMRKTDLTFQQIYWADGNVNYSGNFGLTLHVKTKPTSDPIIGVEVFSI